jgi:hypothetical protein
MGQRASVYLDDLHAAAEASGVPPAELLRRGPADQAQTGASLPTVTARGRTTREIRRYAWPDTYDCTARHTRRSG